MWWQHSHMGYIQLFVFYSSLSLDMIVLWTEVDFSLGSVIREIRLQGDDFFKRFQVFPDNPEKLAVISYRSNIYDLNIQDSKCRLICNILEDDPHLCITNDGQHIV